MVFREQMNPTLAQMIHSLECAIVATDPFARVTWLNASAEKLTGWTQQQAEGLEIEEVCPLSRRAVRQDGPHPIRLALSHQRLPLEHDTQLTTRDGTTPVEGWASPIREGSDIPQGAVLELREVSAERFRDAQALFEEKRQSLGVLAGGVAHDFNNLLTPIIAYAELARTIVPTDSPVYPMLEQIEHAATRAGGLTQQMLTFSGKWKVHLEAIDLSAVVREKAASLCTKLPPSIVTHLELDPTLSEAFGDPSRLQHAVEVLFLNAVEAIEPNEGQIILRTGQLRATREMLRSPYTETEALPGPYVYLEVADTGCGMTEEMLGRIFDPFFSTKFTGRGMSLAVLQGIVQAHSGVLQVHSQPDRGTRFQVLLPARDEG